MRGLAVIAEDMHREVADGAGNPRAVKVEGREIGSPEVLASIHLHPVDDVEKVLAAEP